VCGENEVHPRKALISFAFPSCLSPTSERRLATVCFHCAQPPSFFRRGMTRKRNERTKSETKLHCIIKYNTARNSLISLCVCVEHTQKRGKEEQGRFDALEISEQIGLYHHGGKDLHIYSFSTTEGAREQKRKRNTYRRWRCPC